MVDTKRYPTFDVIIVYTLIQTALMAVQMQRWC